MARGEPGLRRGAGRSGDYAFFWGERSWRVIPSDLIAVDTGKTYELSGFFKSAGEASTMVTFGLLMADAQKRDLKRWNVFSVKGTLTELAAACSPDENVLKVKDASA